VPVIPLILWMKRKHIAPGKENKVVFAIRRHIFINGIKARPFLKTALENANEEVAALLAIDFSDLIDNKIKQILNG